MPPNKYPRYLVTVDGITQPRPEYITLLQADIREISPSAEVSPCDYVFTSSVYPRLTRYASSQS